MVLLITTVAAAQNRPVDFADIDNRVRYIEAAPASILSKKIVEPYKTDREKVRAIFSWVAQHIAYRAKNTRRVRSAFSENRSMVMDEPDTASWKTANDVVAETVLKNGYAVCDGYTRLFKVLCDYAGIPSVIVTGYARSELGRAVPKFRSNHNWNAVYIDSTWHLLDVTWSSGYISYFGDQFIAHFTDNYFLMSPAAFIEDHFPDDLKWTLLPSLPAFQEFERAPYRQKAFIKYNIVSYRPLAGLINAVIGDTIQIEVQTTNPEADKRIGADSICFNNQMVADYNTVAFLHPVAAGNNMKYTYVVGAGDVEWIQLVYNKDIIMQYRLRVQK